MTSDTPKHTGSSEHPSAPDSPFPAGTSELAQRIRAHSWAQTELGPIETWSPTLKTATNLILQSPVPIAILWGAEGTMLYNDAYMALAGRRHPGILGSKVLESWPEVADFNRTMLKAVLGGKALSYTNQHLVLYRSGAPEDVWLDLNYSPILDEQGHPAGVMAIVTETTARLQAEQRRKQAEERFQLALEAGTVMGTWVWDIPGNRFAIDERFARLFALDPQDALQGVPGELLFAAIHPADQERIRALVHATFRHGGAYRAELRVRQADGSYRWVEANGHCEMGEDGAPLRFPGVLIDIAERKQAERALQQNEAWLRAIFDTLPVGIVFAEAPSGRITSGNAQSERILGHPVLHSPSTSAYGEWIAYDSDGALVPIEEYPLYIAVTRGETSTRDLHHQRGDGSRAWIRVLGAPLKDADGEISGGFITIIDIDREKRAEARQAFLLALGDRLRGLSTASEVVGAGVQMLGQYLGIDHCGYGEVDPSGQYLNVTSEWDDGQLRGSIGQFRIADFSPLLDDLRSGRAAWIADTQQDQRVSGEALMARLRGFDMRAAMVVPFFHDERWIALIYMHTRTPRQWSDDDAELLREVAERLRDAIARARAQERLRQLNATLASEIEARTRERDRIWNVSLDLLGIAHLNGIWLSINPAWQQTLGWSEEYIIGRTSEWMSHPDDLAMLRAVEAQLTEQPGTLRFESRLRHSDQSYRWLSWVIVTNDSLRYCVARDVTAEKEQQAELEQMQAQLRQAQKMEAIGQLTGGIAHDFNNLLTGIIGGLDMLQRRMSSGRLDGIERYITTATTSARRAASLTHRLLAFSRRQSLDITPTDINALVISLVDLLRRTLGEGISFAAVLKSNLWPALTDANQLENALLNLCINARDAMPGGGQLTVETSNTHLDESYTRDFSDLFPGDYVVMSVSDTGTGMAPDVLERAFDPFFTTKPIGQGTGLGLSMIYGFVKQAGGHIRIYSEMGHGTTVKLFFPRHNDQPSEQRPDTQHGEHPRAQEGERVLLVEDDPGVRLVVMEVLHDLGYDAIEASDAPGALGQIAQAQRIDLLITDVGLPGMNGRQLAEIVRQQRADLPILFMTGYAEHAITRSSFLGEGMEIISKPFDINELASRIRQMLK